MLSSDSVTKCARDAMAKYQVDVYTYNTTAPEFSRAVTAPGPVAAITRALCELPAAIALRYDANSVQRVDVKALVVRSITGRAIDAWENEVMPAMSAGRLPAAGFSDARIMPALAACGGFNRFRDARPTHGLRVMFMEAYAAVQP